MTNLVKSRSVNKMRLRNKKDKIDFSPSKCEKCKYKRKDSYYYNCDRCMSEWRIKQWQ